MVVAKFMPFISSTGFSRLYALLCVYFSLRIEIRCAVRRFCLDLFLVLLLPEGHGLLGRLLFCFKDTSVRKEFLESN